MTMLMRRFKKKMTTKGGKGDEQAKAEEEAKKRNEEAKRIKLTQQSAFETTAGQTQEVENPEVQTPQVPIPMVPTLKLVPFVQKKGKEIPDFNTVYYDMETKRRIKRT